MRESFIEIRTDSADVLSWYDELSSGYEELYGEEQSRKYAQIFNKPSLRSYLACKNLLILDLGCGTGDLIRFLYHEFPSIVSSYYVGLDLSPSMCFMCREEIDREGLLGDVVAGDIFKLPFRDGIANAVFSITVLTCKDLLREVFHSFKNLLRSNGLLCCSILCSDSRKVLGDDFELCETLTPLSRMEVLCVIKS